LANEQGKGKVQSSPPARELKPHPNQREPQGEKLGGDQHTYWPSTIKTKRWYDNSIPGQCKKKRKKPAMGRRHGREPLAFDTSINIDKSTDDSKTGGDKHFGENSGRLLSIKAAEN